jgi:hypothetical protein
LGDYFGGLRGKRLLIAVVQLAVVRREKLRVTTLTANPRAEAAHGGVFVDPGIRRPVDLNVYRAAGTAEVAVAIQEWDAGNDPGRTAALARVTHDAALDTSPTPHRRILSRLTINRTAPQSNIARLLSTTPRMARMSLVTAP